MINTDTVYSAMPGATPALTSPAPVSTPGVLPSMAKGAMTGASIGTAVAPGVGTAIGAGIGAITSGIKSFATKNKDSIGAGAGSAQVLLGLIMNRRAKNSKPYDVDPEVAAFRANLEMKRKNLAYSGITTAAGTNAVKQNQAAALDKIAATGVGNTGAVASAMGVSQLAADQGVNQVLAQNGQQDQFLTSLSDNILKSMSSRKLDLQMYDYLSKIAMGTQMISGGLDNFGNAIAPIAQKTA